MTNVEIGLFWVTIAIYVVAFCASIFGLLRPRPRLQRLGVTLMSVGFAAHTFLIIARWMAGGHVPVTDAYELDLTGTWLITLVFLLFYKLRKVDSAVAPVVIGLTFLILGNGYMSRTPAVAMGDAFRSPWLIVHVVFAWLSFGSYAISTGTAMLLLARGKLSTWRPDASIPIAENLDDTSYRFIVLGFINHAVMIVSGAIWAKKLWGRYWSWDALETWSLIAFLFYAFYLHARAFLGWKMRRAAWLALAGLLVMAISFWGVGWFAPSVHPGP